MKDKPKVSGEIEHKKAQAIKKMKAKLGYLGKLRHKPKPPRVPSKEIVKDYFDFKAEGELAGTMRTAILLFNRETIDQMVEEVLETCEPEFAVMAKSEIGRLVLVHYFIKKKLLTPQVETYLKMIDNERKSPSKD
jgi:hypothetical protein